MTSKELDKKRQKKWQKNEIYKVVENPNKPKFYVLDMFPYPSGAGLHVGHPKGFMASDCLARKKMLEGFSVLHPMGFDTFGLGTENYAIEHKMKPQIVAKKNIETYIKQLEMFGCTYDRDRCVSTADPEYFKWTQWVFLKLYEHYYDEKEGKAKPITELVESLKSSGLGDEEIEKQINNQRLAYIDFKPINRCPKCKTGLANEDLDDGKCERCASEVEQKPMKQRVLRITKYAERLLTGLDKLDRDESMKELERNWIGKSEGTQFKMKIITEEKNNAAYMVIEKSIEPTARQELLSFGKRSIEETSSNRGNFYRILIAKKDEEKFIEFLGKNLRTKGDDGKPNNWYADSDGTTNMVIFSGGKIFNTSTNEECKKARDYGISLGIPENQVNFSPRTYAPGYKDHSKSFEVYTTRVDTVFGVSFVVMAPEHPLVEKITTPENKDAVERYKEAAKYKSQLERTELQKDKTGQFTGSYAINPFNGEEVPIYIADYVLANYGTGVVMAVPAHDERDFEFAKKYHLSVKKVVEPFTYYADGDSAVREGLPFVDRENVCIILRNPKNETYLCTDWKDHNMHGLITGGIDEGEDIIEAAKREIYEEAGYKNIRYIGDPDFAIHTFFWHRVKQSNRHARFRYLIFELITDERDEISAEEAAVHTLVWKTKEELKTFFTVAEGSFALNILDNMEYIYVSNGILHDSGEFTGMKSEDAINAMQKWLKDRGIGGIKVNYKIQDRVFSRQRYRGEPFPVVFCDHCNSKGTIHFYNQDTWNGIKSGIKTVETRALNPEEPERFFGNYKEGDIITAVNKETNEILRLKIISKYQWENLKDMWENTTKETLEKMYWNKETFRGTKDFESFAAKWDFKEGYLEKLNSNGIIGREIQVISPEVIPMKESDLPLLLPDVENYEPTGTEEGPLADVEEWINVDCPICGSKAKRESNTMPGRAGSSWYRMRYMDNKNDKELVSKERDEYRKNVDVYVGGAEHVTRHMIYARFWQKFLFDIGVVSQDEPFLEYHSVGLIMGEDGRKMSKRRGNVVNPDDIINEHGADTLRTYEMFMGPFDQSIAWSTNGISGVKKFLEKIVKLFDKIENGYQDANDTEILLNQSIKKLTEDIDGFRFNTAVSQLMILVNHLTDKEKISKEIYEKLVILVAPMAPHMAEEMREKLGNEFSIFTKGVWPKYDESKLVSDQVNLAVQINGKMRGTIETSREASENEVIEKIKSDERLASYITGEIKKVIYVKGKIVNIIL